MKAGFIMGALFATWLTLNYPTEVRDAFNKVTTVLSDGYSAINNK
ncbi:hypothetical protein [Photorhabdus heterorhabditis]|nr:hypothetical protein [Photorhabdus heterorhabditis]